MNIIDWLNFGKVSAERDDLLKKYFYDNGVLKNVIESPSAFLILGRKGAGKTAVFKYLSENKDKYIKSNDVLVSLSFEDYNWNIHSLLSNSEKAESLSYKQSWKFIIIIEAIKAINDFYKQSGKMTPKHIDNANKILEKLFDSPIPSIYQIVSKKLLSISSLKLPKAGLDLESGNFDSAEISGGEISFEDVKKSQSLQQSLSENIENLLNFFESAISKVENVRVIICFDRVDEAWDDVSYESSKKVIAGLVSASDSISAQFKDIIKPIIFLREDIFEVLSINDANKLREDCGQLLHWNRDSIQRLLLERVNYFAIENHLSIYSSLDNVFDSREMRQRTKQFNYIMKRTMMRPRDFISFLGRIIESMKEKCEDPFSEESIEFQTIDSESIYNAEAGYSEWLKQEILDEWSVQNPFIRDLLVCIQNHSYTNFTIDDLKREFEKLKGVEIQKHDLINHLRFLFDNSIIGFRLGSSREWRFKCFYPSQGFIDSTDYRVHEGLVRSLNLRETREID